MAELILFHHAQGLTDGVRAFADELRAAGHDVHVPDLYEGRTFPELADGVAHAEQVGFETIVERGRRAADGLPEEIVYAGLSLGVLRDHDEGAATLLMRRVLDFLAGP
jgi:dienelactone hydrolase